MMTNDADFKQLVRDRMAKTGEAYSTARQHLASASAGRVRREPPNTRPVLHITNGDSAAGTIRGAGVDGVILAWADILHEGPVPAGISRDALLHVRARFLAAEGFAREEEVVRTFAERDRVVREHEGDYVLWFEADLYDQLQIIQVLDTLRDLEVAPDRISLVSAGEYPGIAHFGGLGELTASQLAGLFDQRVRLSQETLDVASAAWQAFRAAEPADLTTIARGESRELRFLAEAFERLMQEYPWRSDGLALTQRRMLAAVAEGVTEAQAVFRRVWSRERRPYLGDSTCFNAMKKLAAARHPLLRINGDEESPFRQRHLSLTEAGRDVLFGGVDHVALNGIDRWIGGVHQQAKAASWRYDDRTETIVRMMEAT